MRAVLELELIGDSSYETVRRLESGRLGRELQPYEITRQYKLGNRSLRPWVARILGFESHYGFRREFVRANHKDYSRANSTGERGIYAQYILTPGVYEVQERVSWKNARRYFLRVAEDGTKEEITPDEVTGWLIESAS